MELTVNPGVCGFVTNIRAVKKEKRNITVEIESQCEHVQKIAAAIDVLDAYKELFGGLSASTVYDAFAKSRGHLTCLVPAGILKAIEAESGLALAKDASIIFEK